MRLKDIWPMLGKGFRNCGPVNRVSRKPGVCSNGASHLRKYFSRYTHLLSMIETEKNLRRKK